MGELEHLFDLDSLRKGLLSEPKYVTDNLQWITDEGQKLFEERSKTSNLYERETNSLILAVDHIAKHLPDNITLIDLGAGKSSKSAAMLNSLIQNYPSRRICYIPIDVSDCVYGWREFLKTEYPQLNEQVVHIIPLVMDMINSLKHIDELLEKTEYKEWQRFYSTFGPNSLFLSNSYWDQLFQEITNRIKTAGQGHFVFSYVPWNEHTVSRITEGLYSQVNLPGIMRCVLLGLNKIGGGDLDPSLFEFESEFMLDIPTEDGLGKWAGWAMYASAKSDLKTRLSKFDLELSLKKGERIRLSDDVVKSHYKQESHMRAVAEKCGLQVTGNWPESTGLMASMVVSAKEVVNKN